MMVEECIEMALLLDFYGQLLTSRQYEILDLHYNGDCSLGEIAGQLRISRQGVYDGVKKGKDALKAYEEKLGLVERFTRQQKTLCHIHENLQKIRTLSKECEENAIIVDCIRELENVMQEL